MESPTIRVLLVEADAPFVRLLRQSLAAFTHSRIELVVSERLGEALARLSGDPVDAVLVDLNLPDSQGLDNFRRIQVQAPALPVIILAEFDNETLALQAVRRGAQDYLVKSRFEGRLLSRIIRYAIERKRTEEALRESEQRYRRLLASTTDYIYTVVVDHGISLPATHGPACVTVTGYTAEEYAADEHLWYRMVHPDDRQAVTDQVARLLAGETVRPLEHRILHKDGCVRWVRNTPVPHKDGAGRVISYDGLIADITERKRAETQLLQANAELVDANRHLSQSEEALRQALAELRASHEQLKATQLQLIRAEKLESIGSLAAGVAHEVKNPLQTILMGIAYLSRKPRTRRGNAAIVLNEMRESIKRADSIVRGLVEFSSSNHPDVQDEALNEIIEQSLALVKYELTKQHVTVVRELAAGLPLLKLERNKIQQAFINLFLNAIQAMPEGGRLRVRTYQEPRNGNPAHHGPASLSASANARIAIVAEVEDTGAGIPEDQLPRVFDPFFTTKAPGVGSGLGLPVTRKIVELHGGSIEVASLPGAGARFSLTFDPEPEKTHE